MARKYTLRKNPVAEIEIDGEPYEVQLGNLSFAVEVAKWERSLRGIASGEVGREELVSVFGRLADEGRELVASLVGDAAAEELVGGRNALNFYRLIDVVRILADVVSGEESMEAMRAVSAAPETADED